MGGCISMHNTIHPTSKIVVVQVGGECRVLKKCAWGGEIGNAWQICVVGKISGQEIYVKLHTS